MVYYLLYAYKSVFPFIFIYILPCVQLEKTWAVTGFGTDLLVWAYQTPWQVPVSIV